MPPTLAELEEAIEASETSIPREVLDAFCPEGTKVGGIALVPLTAGHELFLARVAHPLASRAPADWAPHDVGVAWFAFTRSSRELFRMVESETFEDELHGFLDEVPAGDIDRAAAALMAHWLRSRETAVAMDYPAGSAPKKKAASVGGSR
jgi:hypothetical protein